MRPVRAITSGLRIRLLVMLMAPVVTLTLLNAWSDFQSAGNAALQHDRQLLRMVPLLAGSVVAPADTPAESPLFLLAPPLEEFLKARAGAASYSVQDLQGRLLHGDAWLAQRLPLTPEPEFHTDEHDGVIYRTVMQRVSTQAGELAVTLADGSDARQQWMRAMLQRVLLPNLVFLVAAAFAVNWAVRRALKPLMDLTDAVRHRSSHDLSAIDVDESPQEVRPLVLSLNGLFVLVNAQAESQRRFVADAAHQLRTPLAGLQAQVEAWALAADKTVNLRLDAGVVTVPAEQIYKLRSATRRTTQLANQLLALSRADARSSNTQPMEQVDLKSLCESILELHLDAATAKGMDLGLETQPARATGHGWLLRELLGNLVDNAVKYTQQGGTVTIRCGTVAGAVGSMQPYLQVEDDGPGVAESEFPHLLQRFYRVRGTAGEGNGLGLAIADEIARAHRGVLNLRAGEQGRGWVVTLIFPP